MTFRTVDNFINGYGLTWNTAERVQVYTHPMWMFLVSAAYFFTREIYFTSIFLSVATSLMAVIVVAFSVARSWTGALLGVTILTFSKAFTDYSTSGLENPLSHLLLALFLLVYLKSDFSVKHMFLLALIAALAAFNRLDTILLYIPALGYGYFKTDSKHKGLYAIALGFLPLLLWEAFSLFYYGFPFPNTAYAKLNTGIPDATLARQGLNYLLNSIRWDPLTLSIVGGGIVASIFNQERRATVPVAAGIVLYLLYVVKIGGDFMSGRFLTDPMFAATILLIVFLPRSRTVSIKNLAGWIATFFFCLHIRA